MNDSTELQHYILLENNCILTYKFLDSKQSYLGQCTSLSSSGIFFISNKPINAGKALIVQAPSWSATVFIEVNRSTRLKNQRFEIDASIKSIKAN